MAKANPQAQNPLILRFHRLMDAFAKSDDERDFYLDRQEGFLVYVDLDKTEQDLLSLQEHIQENGDRYCLIPKMTFYEVKKFMEGFVNEKVYDIDTKEKLLDIIGAKDSRENFLEFIYDHLTELEKWQAYYQERSRIRIIEWLREENIYFVFEEDLDIQISTLEKVKRNLFESKVGKDIQQAREVIKSKAKTYYSNEALNPRPKRGRPPKQQVKVEVEPQFTLDIYTTVPKPVRPFLYIPDITSATSVTFSARFETEDELLASLRGSTKLKVDEKLEALSQRLESLKSLSDRIGKGKGLGLESIKKTYTPKVSEQKGGEEGKFESAIEQALAGKKLAEGQRDQIFTPQKRKKFSIRQVAQINAKKKKKKE